MVMDNDGDHDGDPDPDPNPVTQIVSAMDAELERYHKSNAGLDLAIQVCAAVQPIFDRPWPTGPPINPFLADNDWAAGQTRAIHQPVFDRHWLGRPS